MFVSDAYKVLELIYEHSHVGLGGVPYCPVTQQEVADYLHLSRQSVNKIFKQLKEKDYLVMETRSRWRLTDQAIDLIEQTQAL